MFRELSEAQVGTINHIGFTATFSRTHWLNVTLIAQTPVLSTCTQKTEMTDRWTIG